MKTFGSRIKQREAVGSAIPLPLEKEPVCKGQTQTKKKEAGDMSAIRTFRLFQCCSSLHRLCREFDFLKNKLSNLIPFLTEVLTQKLHTEPSAFPMYPHFLVGRREVEFQASTLIPQSSSAITWVASHQVLIGRTSFVALKCLKTTPEQ